jgi:hypothetical protein
VTQILRNGLLVVTISVDAADEAELNRWYQEEHVPQKLASPGYLSARRYISAETPGRYLAIFELTDASAAAVTSPAFSTGFPADDIRSRLVDMNRSLWTAIE